MTRVNSREVVLPQRSNARQTRTSFAQPRSRLRSDRDDCFCVAARGIRGRGRDPPPRGSASPGGSIPDEWLVAHMEGRLSRGRG